MQRRPTPPVSGPRAHPSPVVASAVWGSGCSPGWRRRVARQDGGDPFSTSPIQRAGPVDSGVRRLGSDRPLGISLVGTAAPGRGGYPWVRAACREVRRRCRRGRSWGPAETNAVHGHVRFPSRFGRYGAGLPDVCRLLWGTRRAETVNPPETSPPARSSLSAEDPTGCLCPEVTIRCAPGNKIASLASCTPHPGPTPVPRRPDFLVCAGDRDAPGVGARSSGVTLRHRAVEAESHATEMFLAGDRWRAEGSCAAPKNSETGLLSEPYLAVIYSNSARPPTWTGCSETRRAAACPRQATALRVCLWDISMPRMHGISAGRHAVFGS